MKTVQAEWAIDDMPDGEAALAKIERMGRIAYKSEDKIDSGEKCQSKDFDINQVCRTCGGTGWVREPSSHRFVKMILQAERKAKMILMAKDVMEAHYMQVSELPPSEPTPDLDVLPTKLVSNVIGYMRENPAHESVIEHCSATVVFTSNRGFTHEIVRHRLASFTQESTRYCDYNKGKFGGEITVVEQPFYKSEGADVQALAEWEAAMKDCEFHYRRLRQLGVPAQIARGVLPQDLKADIGVTANFRQWRLVFSLRDSSKAHPDMQRLMGPLHEEFRRRIPIVFD